MAYFQFKYQRFLSAVFLLSIFCLNVAVGKEIELKKAGLKVVWGKHDGSWDLRRVSVDGKCVTIPSSQHMVLYSPEKPSDEPVAAENYGGITDFPESQYRYVLPSWRRATTSVALNRAGECFEFRPSKVVQIADSAVNISYSCNNFDILEEWTLTDDADLKLNIVLTAGMDGWYSIATPSLGKVLESNLDYALIPGMLHGHEISDDISHALAYGWGVPNLPVIFREQAASSLTSIITSNDGVTLAVTAEPGTAAEPWTGDKRTTDAWHLGLSSMNRAGELTPTLYHPVLGEDGSKLSAGDTVEFTVRYSLKRAPWWTVLNHVVNDIYRFSNTLSKRENSRSLTERLQLLHSYVVNDSTSKWRTVEFEGSRIGAQDYLGGVYKANKDAMKNADYGAMWMLGKITNDTSVNDKRLPFARNFKLRQQHAAGTLMDGASRGQYFLRNRGEFVEEWGEYIEPIATAYYMLSDLGNMALFEPENQEIRDAITRAADFLLRSQLPDGSWPVAFENTESNKAVFADLYDYRPTFYGLFIAWRITGDTRYLEGAHAGADWLIDNAVYNDKWLGVCGDTRFAPDFATAQTAQALLEMYEATNKLKYREAAIHTARFYVTSVYTHPLLSDAECIVNGKRLKQWQISPAGLSYEHGGVIGSTNLHGPILLASHAGMFIRMAQLTGDSLFTDMARAAAIGRDAFVDEHTGVASYYWSAMNRGAGPYPHHAWWQIGWITDYLLAELELRSNGAISFPAGFITPKVGPHRPYGFADGLVHGDPAQLILPSYMPTSTNPNVEIIMAKSESHYYIMLMNDLNTSQDCHINANAFARCVDGAKQSYDLSLKPYGIEILKIPYKK